MADRLETQVTLSYMHQVMYEMFLSMDHTILSFMDFANWMILCFGFTCSDAMNKDSWLKSEWNCYPATEIQVLNFAYLYVHIATHLLNIICPNINAIQTKNNIGVHCW